MSAKNARSEKPNFRLTTEQQKLVESGLPLLGKFLKSQSLRLHVRLLGWDEAKAIASLGLCRAASDFDAHRGTTFGTYAFYWVWSYLGDALETPGGVSLMRDRYERTKSGQPIYLKPMRLPVVDIVDRRHQRDPADVAADRIDAEEALSRLTPTERTVVRLKAMGCSMPDVGKILGFSRTRALEYYDRAVSRSRDGVRLKRPPRRKAA